MKIKNSISTFIQKRYDGDVSEAQIRIIVKIEKSQIRFNVGHKINPERWDKSTGRVKRNAINKKGVTSHEINSDIERLEGIIRDIIKKYEVEGYTPSHEEFKKTFNKAIGKIDDTANDSIEHLFNEFMFEKGRGWSDASLNRYRGIKRMLIKNYPGMRMKEVSSKTMADIHDKMYERGMQNTTMKRFLRYVSAFFSWAEAKGYKSDWRDYKPEIKTIRNKAIVFLTWDELMRLYALEFIPEKAHLERVRDVFCFQCFTSLRYSDVAKLKKTDVYEDYISVVTEKTDTALRIDLNDRSKAILNKYKDMTIKRNLALPVVCNQKMNEWIKECCALAEINTPVTKVYLRGKERIEEVYKKYELISSHSGRRTFISNALIMGIAPEVVMKWTGHTDYKQMQPYIDVADEERKKAMNLFNK